ncbi:MAG: IS110 family transposase [Deltaproteobacteria bacterium]|nr:IS110 family transposase [Deltaproteobacteria bacterium]
MKHDNVNKYAEFCQFRKEIRGSAEYVIVGIDVAKERHHAFFGTATGQALLKRLLFDNSAGGFGELLERVGQLKTRHGLSKAVFALEPTGNYHKPLANWLLEQGQLLVLVSNHAIAENRQTLDGRWDKNDTKDSANVADLVSQGKCQFFEEPDADLLELRALLSLRKRLKKQEHSIRMQIRNGLVARHFPEFDRHWGSCLTENLAIVRWCLDPRKISAMSFSDFLSLVTTRDRGQRQERRLRAIHEVAASSVGCPVNEATVFEAQTLVERFHDVHRRIEQTEAQIETVCRRFPTYRRIRTIPGFGPYVCSQVLSKIGDPHRFKARKQVVRLAGFDLNAKRSGKRSQTAVPVISKRGNTDLRYALYQAALIASYHHAGFRALFTRYLKGREKERGIRTKMRVKLAAKMLVIAWTMMRTETDFDPNLLAV